MDFKRFPIPFTFSSEVTATELRESFIDTRNANIDELVEVVSDLAEFFPEKALERRPFSYLPDGKKYVSFMSRPELRSHIEDRLIYEKLFGENFQDCVQNDVALLNTIINSAPGDDSLWPYGRYYLWDIDDGIHNKLFGNALHSIEFEFSDINTCEVTWRQISEFYQLNQNIKTFGLLLSNFKDSVTDPHRSFWETLLLLISKFEKLGSPAVDKVAIRQTACQIINKYISVRKNNFDHDQLSQDIQKFRELLNFKEIQKIDFNDPYLDSKFI
jgi:hypothetical protein